MATVTYISHQMQDFAIGYGYRGQVVSVDEAAAAKDGLLDVMMERVLRWYSKGLREQRWEIVKGESGKGKQTKHRDRRTADDLEGDCVLDR